LNDSLRLDIYHFTAKPWLCTCPLARIAFCSLSLSLPPFLPLSSQVEMSQAPAEIRVRTGPLGVTTVEVITTAPDGVVTTTVITITPDGVVTVNPTVTPDGDSPVDLDASVAPTGVADGDLSSGVADGDLSSGVAGDLASSAAGSSLGASRVSPGRRNRKGLPPMCDAFIGTTGERCGNPPGEARLDFSARGEMMQCPLHMCNHRTRCSRSNAEHVRDCHPNRSRSRSRVVNFDSGSGSEPESDSESESSDSDDGYPSDGL
jgi:hypothetical protein